MEKLSLKKLSMDEMEMIEGGSCSLAVAALCFTGAITIVTGGALIGLCGPAIATALACLAEK